jgi:hypothetical protein
MRLNGRVFGQKPENKIIPMNLGTNTIFASCTFAIIFVNIVRRWFPDFKSYPV